MTGLVHTCKIRYWFEYKWLLTLVTWPWYFTRPSRRVGVCPFQILMRSSWINVPVFVLVVNSERGLLATLSGSINLHHQAAAPSPECGCWREGAPPNIDAAHAYPGKAGLDTHIKWRRVGGRVFGKNSYSCASIGICLYNGILLLPVRRKCSSRKLRYNKQNHIHSRATMLTKVLIPLCFIRNLFI